MSEPKKNKSFLNLDPELRKLVLILGYMVVAAGVIIALRVIWPAIQTVINILMPFLVALVVAYIFNPIVNFVQRRMKLTRIGGVFIVNFIVIGIVAGFVAIIIPILVTQVRNAYTGIRSTAERQVIPWVSDQILATPGSHDLKTITDFETFYESRKENLGKVATRDEVVEFLDEWSEETTISASNSSEFSSEYISWFDSETSNSLDTASLNNDYLKTPFNNWKANAEEDHPVTWEDFEYRVDSFLQKQGTSLDSLLSRAAESTQVRSAARSAAEGGAGLFGSLIAFVASVLATVFSSAIFIVFVIILSFYLLLDFSSMRGVIEVLTPDQYEDRLFSVFEKIDAAVGGFIRGQLIVATIVGTMTFVGLSILGMKQYALLIGFIAGIGNLIPYLGPIAGATPAILFMILTDTHDTTQTKLVYLAFTAGLFGIIQAVEGLILQPKIVGNSAQLHPIAVILALAFGGQFGIMGMIIAVPMACIVRVVWKEFFWDDVHKEWQRSTGKTELDDPTPKKYKAPKKTERKVEKKEKIETSEEENLD